jgi:hypothetical protein
MAGGEGVEDSSGDSDPRSLPPGDPDTGLALGLFSDVEISVVGFGLELEEVVSKY